MTGTGSRQGLVCVVVTALAIGCTADRTPEPVVAAPESHSAVRQAIDEAWREHIDAAKRKDAEAVTRIYADNILYVVPGQEARGRDAIDAIEAQTLATADVLDAEHTTDALQVFGDLAYELGTVVGPIRVEGQEPQTVTFHYMATWRRQPDGEWRIESFIGEPETAAGAEEEAHP